MSFIELKSSLGYIWFSFICFLIQIYSHIDNLRIIRYFDLIILEKSKERTLILCLIIVSFTIISSTISIILNLFNGFGNSIEDYPFYLYKYKKTFKSLPLLSLFDIHIGILILLPKLLINTQLIKLNIKDQSFLFESSIDFLIGNSIKGIKKDDLSYIKLDRKCSLSYEILNFFLILIRYNFIYSNSFYKLNKCISIIMSINSIISIILCLITYGTFEIFFKEISIINSSINIYSYLLICSLIISILLILLTNHALYHYAIQLYSQQQYRISNQLIRLSKLDDHYLMSRSVRQSLIFYLLFVILSITCQSPLIILTSKVFLSGLIDNLLLIYIIFILLFLFVSISLFSFLCLFPLSWFNFNYVNQDEQTKSFEYFYRSNANVEEKLFEIESPRLLPTRSISSCGLTIIDHDISNGRNSHPTFKKTVGVATDALLVMH